MSERGLAIPYRRLRTALSALERWSCSCIEIGIAANHTHPHGMTIQRSCETPGGRISEPLLPQKGQIRDRGCRGLGWEEAPIGDQDCAEVDAGDQGSVPSALDGQFRGRVAHLCIATRIPGVRGQSDSNASEYSRLRGHLSDALRMGRRE